MMQQGIVHVFAVFGWFIDDLILLTKSCSNVHSCIAPNLVVVQVEVQGLDLWMIFEVLLHRNRHHIFSLVLENTGQ